MPRILDAELFGVGLDGVHAAATYLLDQPKVAGQRGVIRVRAGIEPGEKRRKEWQALGITVRGLDPQVDADDPPLEAA